MADSSTSMKRKYEEQESTPSPIEPQSSVRRSTGFSVPIASTPSDSSYKDVAVDDIQLAKQRAQEIAARLFNNAASGNMIEAKRPRFDSGFDATDNYNYNNKDVGQKPMISATASEIPSLYGYHQGPNKKIAIPNGRVGVIIGKAGDTIKYLQLQSGAKIQVTRDADSDPNSPNRIVELMGTPEAIAKAEKLINDVLSEAETGGSGTVSRRIPGPSASGDQFVMRIPNNKVGLVIGKGGETIKNMQARTGARIQVIPLHLPPGDTSLERTVQIDGTSEQIESAKLLVNEVISENRSRGGYSQQGYQARPPTQQFGYVQPGAYPGPLPQYQQQQSYGGYPTQANSGGYPSQQSTQGSSGYDYYNQRPVAQQQSQGGPVSAADSNAYNYNQQEPVSSYNQQGYAQSGYNQPQPQVYDQLGNAYGNVTNPVTQGDTAQTPPPAQPSPTAQQSYNVGHQPSPNPTTYPSQPGYGVPGYGPTQTQKPPVGQSVYGQSPTAQGAYAQPSPVQPWYPPSQLGSAQLEVAPQRAAAQPGYAPPYNAAIYGQQQQHPQYNNTYGGGYYSQPQDYVADAAGGSGTARSGVPKASPQSKR